MLLLLQFALLVYLCFVDRYTGLVVAVAVYINGLADVEYTMRLFLSGFSCAF